MALPIPLPPPVMMTVWPLNRSGLKTDRYGIVLSELTGSAEDFRPRSKISTLYYDMVYPVSQALCGAPGQELERRAGLMAISTTP